MVKGAKDKTGSNDPCPCGSGKKYKKCCRSKDRKNIIPSLKTDFNVINGDNELIKDNPSAKEMKKSIEGMKALRSATEAGLLNGLIPFGLDVDELGDKLLEINELEEQFSIFDIPDKFNDYFLNRGWIAHESINFEAMKEAVELADKGQLNEAESVLIESYDSGLEINIQMIKLMEELRPRNELLQLAHEDYLAERYHSCILILFTIIDGLVADTKEIDGNKCFFAKGEEIYAWDSIAAHKTGLTELRKLLYQNRGETTIDEIEIPYRNGILHGRDLGYANKKVAIKLWATLFALKDGIVAIKQKGTEPPEDQKQLNLEDLIDWSKKRDLRDKLLKEWKNRELKVNEDFPETGRSDDYEDGSPEKALVKFFEYWKASNFGKIAQKIDHMNFNRTTLNNLAGKLAREVFKNKKLDSFKILNIIDEGSAISEIAAEIIIQKKEEIITKEITFRMIYETDDGEIEIRTMNNGSWKFIRCFSEIGNL